MSVDFQKEVEVTVDEDGSILAKVPLVQPYFEKFKMFAREKGAVFDNGTWKFNPIAGMNTPSGFPNTSESEIKKKLIDVFGTDGTISVTLKEEELPPPPENDVPPPENWVAPTPPAAPPIPFEPKITRSDIKPIEKIECPECGTEVNESDKKCKFCGIEFEDEEEEEHKMPPIDILVPKPAVTPPVSVPSQIKPSEPSKLDPRRIQAEYEKKADIGDKVRVFYPGCDPSGKIGIVNKVNAHSIRVRFGDNESISVLKTHNIGWSINHRLEPVSEPDRVPPPNEEMTIYLEDDPARNRIRKEDYYKLDPTKIYINGNYKVIPESVIKGLKDSAALPPPEETEETEEESESEEEDEEEEESEDEEEEGEESESEEEDEEEEDEEEEDEGTVYECPNSKCKGTLKEGEKECSKCGYGFSCDCGADIKAGANKCSKCKTMQDWSDSIKKIKKKHKPKPTTTTTTAPRKPRIPKPLTGRRLETEIVDFSHPSAVPTDEADKINIFIRGKPWHGELEFGKTVDIWGAVTKLHYTFNTITRVIKKGKRKGQTDVRYTFTPYTMEVTGLDNRGEPTGKKYVFDRIARGFFIKALSKVTYKMVGENVYKCLEGAQTSKGNLLEVLEKKHYEVKKKKTTTMKDKPIHNDIGVFEDYPKHALPIVDKAIELVTIEKPKLGYFRFRMIKRKPGEYDLYAMLTTQYRPLLIEHVAFDKFQFPLKTKMGPNGRIIPDALGGYEESNGITGGYARGVVIDTSRFGGIIGGKVSVECGEIDGKTGINTQMKLTMKIKGKDVPIIINDVTTLYRFPGMRKPDYYKDIKPHRGGLAGEKSEDATKEVEDVLIRLELKARQYIGNIGYIEEANSKKLTDEQVITLMKFFSMTSTSAKGYDTKKGLVIFQNIPMKDIKVLVESLGGEVMSDGEIKYESGVSNAPASRTLLDLSIDFGNASKLISNQDTANKIEGVASGLIELMYLPPGSPTRVFDLYMEEVDKLVKKYYLKKKWR